MSLLNRVLKRFRTDLEELQRSPLAFVSAAPLETNIFEWHCNIQQDDICYHVILFLPNNYPFEPPTAEFVPQDFVYTRGTSSPGKKGTRICLNIFHGILPDGQSHEGWSPAYTVQVVLANVLSYLRRYQGRRNNRLVYERNLELSRKFHCPDCGHTYARPVPEFSNTLSNQLIPDQNHLVQLAGENPQLVDYVTKDSFRLHPGRRQADLWGYGLAVVRKKGGTVVSCPCEVITQKSFDGMKRLFGFALTALKKKVNFFLPIFIHPDHGSRMKEDFEKTLKDIGAVMHSGAAMHSGNEDLEDLVLRIIPNVMHSTVVEFFTQSGHLNDAGLSGLFQLHRLLLWAMDTYPSLEQKVYDSLANFIGHQEQRGRTQVAYINDLLMTLAAASSHTWSDLAEAYLEEAWKRVHLRLVETDGRLGFLQGDRDFRIKQTFKMTEPFRKFLAFVVKFLDVAFPAGMTREEIIQRYDENLGFPNKDMVNALREASLVIQNVNSFADWYQLLHLPSPSNEQLSAILVEATRFCLVTPNYHLTGPKAGGWKEALEANRDLIRASGRTRKSQRLELKASKRQREEDRARQMVPVKKRARETYHYL